MFLLAKRKKKTKNMSKKIEDENSKSSTQPATAHSNKCSTQILNTISY